jgi:arylsulfatase A-like enzyme
MAQKMPWSPYPNAEQVTSAALQWLNEKTAIASPYFMWIHYMDAHFPTLPPGHRGLRERTAAWSPMKSNPEKYHNLLVDLYKSSLIYIDQQIGTLLSSVIMDETIVTVTADHGQLFGEHSSYWHNGVWEQLIKVPLMVAGPNISTDKVYDLVQLLDLSPHLLKLLGVEKPRNWVGNELGESVTPIYAVSNNPSAHTYTEAVIEGDWKTVRTPDTELRYERRSESQELVLSNGNHGI